MKCFFILKILQYTRIPWEVTIVNDWLQNIIFLTKQHLRLAPTNMCELSGVHNLLGIHLVQKVRLALEGNIVALLLTTIAIMTSSCILIETPSCRFSNSYWNQFKQIRRMYAIYFFIKKSLAWPCVQYSTHAE